MNMTVTLPLNKSIIEDAFGLSYCRLDIHLANLYLTVS